MARNFAASVSHSSGAPKALKILLARKRVNN